MKHILALHGFRTNGNIMSWQIGSIVWVRVRFCRKEHHERFEPARVSLVGLLRGAEYHRRWTPHRPGTATNNPTRSFERRFASLNASVKKFLVSFRAIIQSSFAFKRTCRYDRLQLPPPLFTLSPEPSGLALLHPRSRYTRGEGPVCRVAFKKALLLLSSEDISCCC